MSSLKGAATLFPKDTFSYSATAETGIGVKAHGQDGEYRYVKAGATTLVPGTLVQSPAVIPDHINLVVNTSLTAVGATQVKATLGGTALTANYYAGGTLLVSNGGGIGYAYKIASHPAADASANVFITLDSAEAIKVAANSTTRVDLISNRFQNVIINPTTPTGSVVGVAVAPIPNAQFGYVKVSGAAPVLVGVSTPAVGQLVSPSGNTAGAVDTFSTSNSTVVQAVSNSAPIGRMLSTGVSAHVSMVDLDIE